MFSIVLQQNDILTPSATEVCVLHDLATNS